MKTSILKKMAFALPFVLMFSNMSFAKDGDLGGETYDGSASKPYQISDADDLKAFAKLVNDGVQTGAYAVLTTDIDMNQGKTVLDGNGDLYNNGEGLETWTPIGTFKNSYDGTFDGNGHTIRGLYFNDESTDYVGLFGYIYGFAIVQNVGVVDSYFKGHGVVGGVVGINNRGTVSNVYNAGSVSGAANDVGGVVGYNTGTVSNVYNAGSVSGATKDVGGVVGGTNSGGTVSNVYNTGTVSGTTYVGGVIGYNNSCTISNVYNTGSVSGGSHVGGVVGSNWNSTVSNVYNTGSVSGNDEDVGGVIGYRNSSGTVSYAYYNTAYYSGNAIGGGSGTANEVVGKTSAELAALGIDEAFKFAEGEENPWTAGSKVSGDGYVTYKFPYLTAFGAKSQPVLSPAIEFAAGNASAIVYGATTGSVNISSEITVNGPITFNRAFPDLAASDAYSTIMLPFEPANKPTGATFYTLGSISSVNGNWKISATEVTGALDANTPYLVKVASGTKSITFNGGTFKATEGEHSVTSGNWKFVGTYEYKAWPKNDPGLGKTYGFAANDGVNDPLIVGKFAKVGAGAYIYPMRAYLEYNASAAGRPAANGASAKSGATISVASLPEEIEVVIVDKDETTGEETTKVIGSLNTRTGEIKFANDRWFDLNGRYLGNKKPTQKGAYYNNGKKVIVK